MKAPDEHVWTATGVVVRGEQVGRRLGFPTANVDQRPGTTLPGDGVYAGTVELDDGTVRAAAISVGTNPTFDRELRTLEAHLLDFDGDLYDRQVKVTSIQRLRGMTKFSGVPELIDAIAHDVTQTRHIVGHLVPASPPR